MTRRDDLPIGCAVVVILVYAAAIAACVGVAIHFIRKWW